MELPDTSGRPLLVTFKAIFTEEAEPFFSEQAGTMDPGKQKIWEGRIESASVKPSLIAGGK